MGGMIAQQLTIDHPDRVLSLCSIMSNTGNRRHGSVSPRLLPTVAMSMSAPRPEDPAEAERLAVEGFRLIAGPHFDADEIAGMVRTAISRNVNPLGTIRQLVAIQASPDRTAGLQQVTVPTLVIHGLRDQLVMPSGGIATARAVPGSRLVAFPDMAHDLPGPRRAEIVEEIARNAERARAADPQHRRTRCAPTRRRARCARYGWSRASATASTSMPTSSSVTTSGGAMRMVDPWVSLARMPRLISRSHSSRPLGPPGSMSRPAHSPRTRTAARPSPPGRPTRGASRSASTPAELGGAAPGTRPRRAS